jgi:hypothetical protein
MPPIVTQIITSYRGLSKEHNPIAAIRQHLGNTCPKSVWTVTGGRKLGAMGEVSRGLPPLGPMPPRLGQPLASAAPE